MSFGIGERVQITGNHSQGIRHYDLNCLIGYIELRRNAMLLKGKVEPVHAYHVRLDNGYCSIVAVEDLTRINDEQKDGEKWIR